MPQLSFNRVNQITYNVDVERDVEHPLFSIGQDNNRSPVSMSRAHVKRIFKLLTCRSVASHRCEINGTSHYGNINGSA